MAPRLFVLKVWMLVGTAGPFLLTSVYRDVRISLMAACACVRVTEVKRLRDPRQKSLFSETFDEFDTSVRAISRAWVTIL